jgi:hypothetical protein
MKTLFLFEDVPNSYFFELKGDYRYFNNCYIDSLDNVELSDKLHKLVYNNSRIKKLTEPTKDWNYFVKCGYIH